MLACNFPTAQRERDVNEQRNTALEAQTVAPVDTIYNIWLFSLYWDRIIWRRQENTANMLNMDSNQDLYNSFIYIGHLLNPVS